MKKFSDIPVYFVIIGFLLNILIGVATKANFTTIMIRSVVVTILFAVMGYALAKVMEGAHLAIKKEAEKREKQEREKQNASTFDVRVESEDDDDLLRMLPKSDDEDFVEIDPKTFERFMHQD